jgi:NADPH-dependent 2,4-dienoyl-CoA reductase/sulfur reductase-like enzyme/rhodanese-related sulfurtransferase
MKTVLIIGGMAAGCKTATRLKRLQPDYKITIIEKKPFVSYGTCGMPFYASGDVEDFMALASTPWDMVRDADYFKNAKDINVLTQTEVIKIDNNNKILSAKNLITQQEIKLKYDYLVFATGAKPAEIKFPHPESDKILDFHNPLNAKKFKELAQTGKIGSVAIIGGGYIGVELAEAMVSLWGIETHLIEMTDRLLPNSLDKEISDLLVKTLSNEDINIYLQTTVQSIETDENLFVHLSNSEVMNVDLVFNCTGIKPNTSLAQSIGIKTNNFSAIEVDEQLRTNLTDIWAAGDCICSKNLITNLPSFFPLGSLANRQGKIVAESIAGLNPEFKGAIGTNSIKVFGFTICSAGINEKFATQYNLNFASVWGTFYDRPDYMPASKTIFAKMLYEKNTLRLLGLQLAGAGELTRYIDAFSVFASDKKTAYDLTNFEHAYTPTHSNPMNPLNFLGAMAISQEKDGIICAKPYEINNLQGQILDVREKEEIKALKCEGNVIETSIMEFRNRIMDLDKTKPLLVVCQKGPRSYEIARFCRNSGFIDVKYLGGGLHLARLILDKTE